MYTSRSFAVLALAIAGRVGAQVAFTPPTVSPYISPGDSKFGYIGIINNALVSVLTTVLSPQVTHVEDCLAICENAAITYNFAVISNGGNCGCTVTSLLGLGISLTPTSSVQLNTVCAGNIREWCGGTTGSLATLNLVNTAMVYQRRATALVAADVATPWVTFGDSRYSFAGALTDPSGNAVQLGVGAAGTILANAGTTIESCLTYCTTGNYQYAALSNGVNCFCSNAIAAGAGVQVATSQLNIRCGGSAYELCGGTGGILSVYKTAAAVFPPTVLQVTSSSTAGALVTSTVALPAATVSGCFATTIYFNSPSQESALEASLAASYRICATVGV